jgi:orotate phosphoribosyltransferase
MAASGRIAIWQDAPHVELGSGLVGNGRRHRDRVRGRPVTRAELAAALGDASWLTGQFTLRSGQTAHGYFDKFRFTSDPVLLRAVARELVALIPEGTEVLAGLELGGVPIATALSLETGLPVTFVRKEAKRYGTERLAEGPDIDGRRLVIIEDVISTGGQVAISAGQLRALGARVDHAICVVDRTDGDHPVLDDAAIELRSLFTSADVPEPPPAV